MTRVANCEGFNLKGYRCKLPALPGTRRCTYHPLGDAEVDARKARRVTERAGKRTVREELREFAEQEVSRIVGVYQRALEAVNSDGDPDIRAQLTGVSGLMAEVYGKPVQPTEEKGAVSFVLVRSPKLTAEQMLGEDANDELPLQ